MNLTKLQALKAGGVMVNIVNLIDRRRNPHTPLLKFTDFGKFRKYTKLYPYPKEKAKKDGYIRVLLRHVW